MKKALVTMFALSLMVVIAAPAFADFSNGTGLVTFGSSGTIPCSYGLSNNVVMTYTSGNTGQDYAIGDKHASGNREFFTTNQTTNIYYVENNAYKGLRSITNSLPAAGATTASGTPL
jgi:hypothetical protein